MGSDPTIDPLHGERHRIEIDAAHHRKQERDYRDYSLTNLAMAMRHERTAEALEASAAQISADIHTLEANR